MKGAIIVALGLVLGAGRLTAQECQAVRLVNAHGAASAAAVRVALSAPHLVRCGADTGTYAFPSDSALPRSVVYVGHAAAISDTVHGDVVVFGGDLFLRPGAHIDGRAIAICGTVYPSALASVGTGVVNEECDHIRHTADGPTVLVEYWPESQVHRVTVRLPVFFGFRYPNYDRTDGLLIPWGPSFVSDPMHLSLDPIVTYRSNLGHFDPALGLTWTPQPGLSITASGERGTFSNDDWSRLTIFNSTASLISGSDARNYYRSDRVGLVATRAWGEKPTFAAPYVAVRDEFDRSVGPDARSRHYAWSLIDPLDTTGIRRPNPPIDRGRIVSALAGLRGGWAGGQGVLVSGSMSVEFPFSSPALTPGGGTHWVQTTIDADVKFPTFVDHTFEFTGHAVATAGDSAPRQRYAYLGGSATIPTLDMLQEGGDELFWMAATYMVPLHFFTVPFIGPPSVGAYFTMGSAGVKHLPRFNQNVGPQVLLGPFQFQFLIDPATHKHNIAIGAIIPASL